MVRQVQCRPPYSPGGQLGGQWLVLAVGEGCREEETSEAVMSSLACTQIQSADPFYSDEHIEMLERRIADMKAGRNMHEHDLIEVE